MEKAVTAKNLLRFFFFCCLVASLVTVKTAYSYEVKLDYYAERTLDTVTPKGIYSQVIVFLNAPKSLINKISYVNYQLQEPFSRKSIVCRSKQHNFQLVVNTLTHFYITAQVHFSDGKNLTLTKYLILKVKKTPKEPAHDVSLSHEVLNVSSGTRRNKKEKYSVSLLLEGSANELAQVKKVEYYLPESFSKAPITLHAPSSDNFQLKLEIEQESSIQAYIYFKDGAVMHLVRFIYFKYY